MGEDPVDPGGKTPGAAHCDGRGEGEQRHRQDQAGAGGPTEQHAQRKRHEQRLHRYGTGPPEPLHALAFEARRARVPALRDARTDRDRQDRLGPDRPQGQ